MNLLSNLKYRLRRYFFSSRSVFPIIILMCSIGVLYSIKPMYITSGYILSSVLIFLIMVFVSMNIGNSEITVEEQLLFLRFKRWIDYYICRELSLIVICVIYSLILALAPVYINVINNFDFFLRKLTVYDVIIGFLLILGSGLLGTLLGDLLNQRVMKNRKLSGVLTVLITILAVVNESIQHQYDRLEILNYIIPPVMIPPKVFAGADVIDAKKMCIIFLQMLIYILVLTSIKIWIMNKNRFE